MPTELVQRIDLDKLYPPFVEAFLNTLAQCQKLGSGYFATLGFRTVAQQNALYFQGRTSPGKKVTNARGGLSAHNYGLAVDVVFDVDNSAPGLQPGWNAKDYDVLAETGKKYGLQVGVQGLADYGHVQLPLISRLGRKEVDVLTELKGLIGPKGEMTEVWKKLDAWGFDKLTPP